MLCDSKPPILKDMTKIITAFRDRCVNIAIVKTFQWI